MSESLISSFLVSAVSESLRWLTKNERCEQIAQVAQKKATMSNSLRYVAQRKWAIVSESLRTLTKNERMSESFIFFIESLIRSFLGKNERFAGKTDERIPRPAILEHNSTEGDT